MFANVFKTLHSNTMSHAGVTPLRGKCSSSRSQPLFAAWRARERTHTNTK
uniref:Uncharacterized protein n=1 Tax=Anguilla anguilla TaxID=7936 RepID=A0A0E9Q0B3_ANGAN